MGAITTMHSHPAFRHAHHSCLPPCVLTLRMLCAPFLPPCLLCPLPPQVLAQFVGTDPHLGNLLHMELASKRWRERFVQLAQSPHPDVSWRRAGPRIRLVDGE